jgi:3-oxoacyl-[acyl-carrier protein] reductase
MDLGIAGKKALVCAASKGLGKGCAMALAQDGVELTILARGKDALEATAAEIRAATGVKVTTVVCDITTAEGRKAALAACPEPDILVNNAGGPPPGDFREWDRDVWIKALDANMLTPIELIRATIDKMIARRFGLLIRGVIGAMRRRRWGRIVNITSSAVKAPIDILGLSNGARSGLTGFVAGLARKTVRHNVTINNLLPGAMDTDRLRSNIETVAKTKRISVDQARTERMATMPAGRFGTSDEFGAACAWLCSRQAGYITGQNWLVDGGAYPGTF